MKRDGIIRTMCSFAVAMPCVLMFADNAWLQLTGAAYMFGLALYLSASKRLYR